jgi:predicted pyridoxine 5'-phosphate oxidase superfamily flavin-nucleotide-binding protein
MSTSNSHGECTASPRGDMRGFVLVLDEKRFVIPERPGNKKMDSLLIIITNPRVGLLFFIRVLVKHLESMGRKL